MRLESNIALFFIFLFGMLFFGYFCKKQKWENFLSKLFFVLFCSLLFPAFIPGQRDNCCFAKWCIVYKNDDIDMEHWVILYFYLFEFYFYNTCQTEKMKYT